MKGKDTQDRRGREVLKVEPLIVGFPRPASPVRTAASCTSPGLSSTPRPPGRRSRAPRSPWGRLLWSSRLKSATPLLCWPPHRSAQQKRTNPDVRPRTAPPESGPNPRGPIQFNVVAPLIRAHFERLDFEVEKVQREERWTSC